MSGALKAVKLIRTILESVGLHFLRHCDRDGHPGDRLIQRARRSDLTLILAGATLCPDALFEPSHNICASEP